MNGRYELKQRGREAERGNRSSSLGRARRELAAAVPAGARELSLDTAGQVRVLR